MSTPTTVFVLKIDVVDERGQEETLVFSNHKKVVEYMNNRGFTPYINNISLPTTWSGDEDGQEMYAIVEEIQVL